MTKELLAVGEMGHIEMVAAPSISIVIPTYQHLDLLKACIDSIALYTDLTLCEVVIVANGCTDGTVQYLEKLPRPFRHVVHAEPLGFTKATNIGIQMARGEYIILLNNDTVILPQPRNQWVDILLAPFRGSHKVGISGPVKFTVNRGGTRRTAIAFWCAMVKRELFEKLGPLDEAFSPGMGEDEDFSIKTELAGYALIQVPKDGSEEFGKGIPNQTFPIYHLGSGTFRDKDYSPIAKRNTKILEERYGRKGDRLEEIYNICLNHPSDINELFPVLRKYAEECPHITEFGVRGVFSTYAFLAARPKRYIGYDIEYNGNIEAAKTEAQSSGINFEFVKQDVLQADIEPTDLLFIDTLHTYKQLKAELARHSGKARKYILIHDVESFGRAGEDGGPGELQAIEEFLAVHPEWGVREHLRNSNGLMVLERREASQAALPAYTSGSLRVQETKISIVVPTAGYKWEQVLLRCLKAVDDYTDMSGKEVIVVANGAPREALNWLKSLTTVEGGRFRTLEFPERIGYIRAVNAGIAAAGGEYVITLDDDSFLQPQKRDDWIRILQEPFLKDPTVGAASPFATSYPDIGQVLHSGCTMYKKADLLKLNPPLFDEAFNPGYLGDEDLAIRIRKAGKRLVEVPEGHKAAYVDGYFQIRFPVVHMGDVNTMDKNGADRPLVAKNRVLLLERHGKPESPVKPIVPTNPKVSIIIPTYKQNFRVDGDQKIDILKENLKNLAVYTDLKERNVEVLVVCNGCRDGQEEYVRSLGEPFRVISFQDPLGYTKATNEGIKAATGDYLIFLNDDAVLLPQYKNQWLDFLIQPFLEDPKMGITGPLQLFDDYAGEDVIIGFCLCIKKSVMQEAMKETGGLLDEIYSPGSGEDIDLCVKVKRAGYKVRQVPEEGSHGFSHTNVGAFQIYHVNNQTFKDIEEYTRWIVKRNGKINMNRYNRNIRLNVGSGGCFIKGYLSVDLHDRRADIIADMTALDMPDNSVTEILCIHAIEHIPPYKVDSMLVDWLRILKPGGKIVLELPDVEDLCKRFIASTDFNDRWGVLNALYAPVNTTGEGSKTGEHDTEITSPHLYGYWPEELRQRLLRLGYVKVTFGKEKWEHPYPPNMHVEAWKEGQLAETSREEMPMAGLWNNEAPQPTPYGCDTTYRKAMDFLADCQTVEDWGCGSAYAKTFAKTGQTYVGVDASKSKYSDVVADLRYRRSNPEGILIRHILEHNWGWRKILENVLESAKKKIALIVFTPFGEETKSIATNWSEIPDLSFKKGDITGYFKGYEWREETLQTHTQYGQETIFYIERR